MRKVPAAAYAAGLSFYQDGLAVAAIRSGRGMTMEYVMRFVIGGAVVSIFAVAGDMLRPKSFAGLLGAAPSVALATLALGFSKHGAGYVRAETISMRIGAVALAGYSFASASCLSAHNGSRSQPHARLSPPGSSSHSVLSRWLSDNGHQTEILGAVAGPLVRLRDPVRSRRARDGCHQSAPLYKCGGRASKRTISLSS
jgi:hypothetical protein